MKPETFPPDIDRSELDVLPLERAHTIPSRWYAGPEFHEFEQRIIFSSSWQYAGHASKLLTAGDQVVTTVGGNPVLAVRGDDQVLRAFYNVCRHRGGPLAIEDCSTKVLQCKYHGWTYRLDGSLRGTPRFDRTELFEKREYGLIPVNIGEWENLVFISLSEGISLDTLFAGIAERIKPISLQSKHFFKRVSYDVQCNWKVYVDNFLEGYHLPYVHPELCTLLDYQRYETETFEYYSLQHSPLQGKDRVYRGDGPAYYFFVWPNFMMNILPGRLQTNLVLPLNHNSCLVHFDYYYDDCASENGKAVAEEDLRSSDKIQQEDIEICELVQRGLESRAYDKGRFSPDCEQGVYHFQSLLKRAYRSALGL